MHLQPTSSGTCALVLFGNNLDKIKQLCQFKVIFGPLKPEVYRIAQNKLLLNNISSLTVYRKEPFANLKSDFNTTEFNLISRVNITASQSVYNIPCEAEVHVHNETFVSSEFCGNFSPEIDTTIKLP